MSSYPKILKTALLGLCLAMLAGACKKGTGEKVGENIDEAVEETKDAASDLKKDIKKKL